jgi:hypothetical protein
MKPLKPPRVELAPQLKRTLFATMLMPLMAHAGVVVTQAELNADEQGAVLTVALPASVQFKTYSLTKPNRVVLDLQGVELGPELERLVTQALSANGAVNRVRVARTVKDAARIILYTAKPQPAVVSKIEDAPDGNYRVLVQWGNAPMAKASPDIVADGTAAIAPAAQLETKAVSVTSLKTLEAKDQMSVSLTPQYAYTSFNGAPTRNDEKTVGLTADIRCTDSCGLSFGASHTDLRRLNGLSTIRQDAYVLSGKVGLTPEGLPGTLSLRFDAIYAKSNDSTNETNHAKAISPSVSFLNLAKTQYADLGYARTTYGTSNIGNGDLTVDQWTPTVAFNVNEGADWLQFRLYDIRLSNQQRAQGKSRTDAIEAKWTHNFKPAEYTPDQIKLTALLGERIYGVDVDAAVIHNLSDLQKGGVSATAQWKLSSFATWQLLLGYDRLQAQNIGSQTNYSSTYVYTGMRFDL